MAKLSKNAVVTINGKNELSTNNNDHVIANDSTKEQAAELPTDDTFFKISQQFGLESAILPVEKQMPIEDRCTKRARLASLRKQRNLEAIMDKTYGFCASKAINNRTDLDWFNRFISLAEDVSNSTMQDLWAKILAGELARPGSYSLKALKVFRDMSIVDAKLLAKACSLSLRDKSRKNIRLIVGSSEQPGLLNFFSKGRQQFINLSQFGLNYADLLLLADNNLIFAQESESAMMANGEHVHFNYNGLSLALTSKKANVALQFYKFTPIGTELAALISDKINDDFIAHMKLQLSHHFNVTD